MRETTSPEHMLAQLVSGDMLSGQVREAQWPEIIEASRQHNLGPILFHKIHTEAGLEHIFEPLRLSAQIATATFMAQDAARWQINTALRDAEIPCLWVKGSALAYTVYPAPELRPMVDLDILVPVDHLRQAEALLYDLGYRPPEQETLTLPSELVVKHEHHLSLLGGTGGSILVELHWRLLNQMILDSRQGGWFWGQTEDIELNGHTMTTLKPEAHLLYLCAHALLQHGEIDSLLMHYLDLHLLVNRYPIHWPRLIEHAVTFKWTYAVERALMIAFETFSTPIPADILEKLRQQRPAEEMMWQVDRLVGPGSRFEHVLRLMQGESIRSKIGLIMTILFPARSYMRARYAVNAGQALWPWYLRRWANQSMAVWRALRARWR